MDRTEPQTPEAPDDALLGTTLEGRYRVIEAIGRGGMGVVYRARQINVDRDVALKVVGGRDKSASDTLARFESEARIISQLRHPNTLKLHDFGRLPDGRLYIVTELLLGRSLEQELERGPLAEQRAIGVLSQICDSLIEAHDLMIVHRDLKPHNVFLERVGDQEVVKVLDFGIAKVAAKPFETESGVVIGTPAYMSPEQAQSRPIDARSDLYGLGVIAYQCMAGALPFVSDTAVGLLFKHVNEAPTPPSRRTPPIKISASLERLVLQLLEKDPARRPESAIAVRDALRIIAAGGRPAPAVGRGSSKGRWVPAVALLAVALGAGLLVFETRGPRPVVSAMLEVEDPGVRYLVPAGHSPSRGGSEPLVTIVEFNDLQCPYSKLGREELDRIAAKHGSKIREVWKEYPLGAHPAARPAAWLARETLVEKGLDGFWRAVGEVFRRQAHLDPPDLAKLAAELGLDASRWAIAGADPAIEAALKEDAELADKLLIGGTPTYFVNGKRVLGPGALERVVDQELAEVEARLAAGIPRDRALAELGSGAIEKLERPRIRGLVPQKANAVRGGPEASAVLLQEICDLENTFCALSEPTMRRLLERYGDRVRLVWWDFHITDGGPHLAERAARAAQRQVGGPEGWLFWPMHDLILQALVPVDFQIDFPLPPTREVLRGCAEKLGADLSLYDYSVNKESDSFLRTEAELLKAAGVTQAPLLLIDGYVYGGSEPMPILEAAIERALQARGGR